MAEEKQPLVLALGRGYNGFYCPETRFHLIGIMKPQDFYTASSLSEDVKRGLRGGTLVDMNDSLTKEDLKPGKGFNEHTSSSDRKKELSVETEEDIKKQKTEDIKNGEEKDDYSATDFSGKHGTILSEPDILSGTKKELLKFVEDTEGIDMDSLELNARSNVQEIKDALISHFGYDDKPVDVEKKAKAEAEADAE